MSKLSKRKLKWNFSCLKKNLIDHMTEDDFHSKEFFYL